jgi:photosystem II stability/assembly factor-like uncharacterized protein
MKKPYLFLSVLMMYLFVLPFIIKQKPQQSPQILTIPESEKKEESGADRHLMMWFQSKGYPNPDNLGGRYAAAWEQFLEIRRRTAPKDYRVQAANWTSLGDVSNIGGRMLCISIDPNNSNNLWAGSASGGIWKSTNAGASWASVTTNLPVLGVSSILIDPSNSNVIYAGTGEVYRVDTSNTGFNVWKTRGTYGIGIIKSTNGGVSWSQVMTKTSNQLFGIQMLKFDPANSNTIYACATDGLYRSTNNGTSWSKILDKIYVSDVAVNPSNTDQIVAAIGNLVNNDKGIYRTTNGSSASPTWTKITSGLPATFMGYIRFAQTGTSDLYASIGLNGTTSGNELYQSSNFGSTWTAKSNSNHCNYQHWFAHDAAINPNNDDQLLICGVSWYRYTSSTSTRTSVSTPGHADVHDIVYDPNVLNRVYVAHDGGISVSNDAGVNFSTINSGLRATQFYAVFGTHPTNPDVMIGGLQDNGVVRYNGSSWATVFGGDGGPSAIATNGSSVLASNDARGVRRSTTGVTGSFSSVLSSWAFSADDRTGFMAPVAISKSDNNYMYVATDNIHRSTDGGSTWTNPNYSTATAYIELQRKTAIALAVSPVNRDKIYVSTSNIAQNTTNDYLWVNGQPNVFKSTTPSTTPYTSIKGSLPDRFVMDFAISPTNDDSVFIALGGFGTSHIYVTGDGGATWAARGAGLPDVPFNALVFDPLNSKIIYAGCDFGVYVSSDRGQTWVDYNNGFWDATLVMDLQITADNKLVAATHGKGAFIGNLYSGGTLPAKLIDFSGINRGSYNQLTWIVTEEQNIDRYEIERSSDGINYQKVAAKLSVNSMTQKSYSLNDPAIGAAEYYYRLKIVENDGSFTFSSVIYIRTAGKTKISVQNNPFRNEIIIRYNTTRVQKLSVGFYNSAGAIIKRQDYHVSAGSGVYTFFGFGNIPPGIYFLKAECDDLLQTFKLVKQ